MLSKKSAIAASILISPFLPSPAKHTKQTL